MKKAIALVIITFTTLLFWNTRSDFNIHSDDLAVSMIAAARHRIENNNRRFGLGRLVSTREMPTYIGSTVYFSSHVNPEEYNVTEYRQQIGLQGWIFYFMTRYGLPNPYHALRLGCSLLLALVLWCICHELYRKYGLIFSGVFYAVTITSPWIVKFASNLYWVEFTWFIPMLLGLVCLNNLDKRLFLYPLFFLAIAVKSACGYEYIPVIMLSSIMFLIVEWVCSIKKGKEKRQYSNSLLRSILGIGIMSLLGFTVTLLIHSWMRGAGDILTGLNDIYRNDVLRRTFGNVADFPESYTLSLNASIADVLLQYLTRDGAGLIALLLLIATTAIMIYKHKTKCQPLDTEFWLFIVSFLTCTSWFVLGKSHSASHPQVNYVLWYMGYIQVCTYIVVKFVLNSDIGKSMLKQAASILRTEVFRDI
jgi:hypothetical protein